MHLKRRKEAELAEIYIAGGKINGVIGRLVAERMPNKYSDYHNQNNDNRNVKFRIAEQISHMSAIQKIFSTLFIFNDIFIVTAILSSVNCGKAAVARNIGSASLIFSKEEFLLLFLRLYR